MNPKLHPIPKPRQAPAACCSLPRLIVEGALRAVGRCFASLKERLQTGVARRRLRPRTSCITLNLSHTEPYEHGTEFLKPSNYTQNPVPIMKAPMTYASLNPNLRTANPKTFTLTPMNQRTPITRMAQVQGGVLRHKRAHWTRGALGRIPANV